MFLEPSLHHTPRRGWIEVICGPMFSGKTEELLRRLRRAEFARQSIEIFKSSVDKRYHPEHIVSHDRNEIPSTPVDSSSQLLLLADHKQVVGIDEAQFFDMNLPEVCSRLADQGVRVIVAGLDLDYQGRPFGPIPALMAMAEHVTKVNAVCLHCGDAASFSHRRSKTEELILTGEAESYEPLCRHCFSTAKQKERS